MKVVEARVEANALVLKVLTSRLDAASASEFKKICAAAWQPGITSVSADLSQLEFVDSSGVGAFLSLYRQLPPPNPSVRLMHARPQVQAVIEMLRLHRIFEVGS